ncbi:thioesterase [Spirochaetia bacterium]|nr:thioesterase [Spirochaetia bacterium]
MFTFTIQPRIGDVDGFGHINNTVPAFWFETARNPLFKIFVPDLSISLRSWPMIMAHTDYDFVAELFFHYEVEIRTFVSRIGAKSFTVGHEAWQQGQLCVKGHAVVVHYDFNTKQSLPIPEDKKKMLAEHLLPNDSSEGYIPRPLASPAQADS